MILAEMVFNFYALACARDCSKGWVIPSQTMQKIDISWDGPQLACAGAYSNARVIPFQTMQEIGIRWDRPQFLCISLCRSLPKSMSYPIPEHAEKLVSAEIVSNFHALAWAGAYLKVWVTHLRPCRKLILAETVFIFHALACAGAYSKVWVILSQTMQTNW